MSDPLSEQIFMEQIRPLASFNVLQSPAPLQAADPSVLSHQEIWKVMRERRFQKVFVTPEVVSALFLTPQCQNLTWEEAPPKGCLFISLDFDTAGLIILVIGHPSFSPINPFLEIPMHDYRYTVHHILTQDQQPHSNSQIVFWRPSNART